MTLERPMFPPSRRGFLALVGGSAAAVATVSTQPSMAALAGLPDVSKASPAMKDAVIALRESHEALEAAQAAFAAADDKVTQWEAENPQPTSKRGKKRYWRKWSDYRNEVCDTAWHAQLDAEDDFKKAQGRVAKLQPANRDELYLMAAVAAIYDAAKLASGNDAIISYGFVLSYFRLSVSRADA